MTSSLVSWIKSNFQISSIGGSTDISDEWNDFVDVWNNDLAHIIAYVNKGTKLTIVKVTPPLNVPTSINIPFFGTVDIWDALFYYMWYDLVPSVNFLGFSVPPGVIGYAILKNIRVPFIGSDSNIKLPQDGTATRFGGLTVGFTFKDLSYDIFKFWLTYRVAKAFGGQAVNSFMTLLGMIQKYLSPNLKDIIDRLKDPTDDYKFDDETETSIRELLLAEFNQDGDSLEDKVDEIESEIKKSPYV